MLVIKPEDSTHRECPWSQRSSWRGRTQQTSSSPGPAQKGGDCPWSGVPGRNRHHKIYWPQMVEIVIWSRKARNGIKTGLNTQTQYIWKTKNDYYSDAVSVIQNGNRDQISIHTVQSVEWGDLINSPLYHINFNSGNLFQPFSPRPSRRWCAASRTWELEGRAWKEPTWG